MDVNQIPSKIKNKAIIKREPKTLMLQQADDHHTSMEDDDFLTADQDDRIKKKSCGVNNSNNGNNEGSSGKKGLNSSGASTSMTKCCQAEKCSADLSDAKQYHRRHKVCELHAKAQEVVVGGILQRFCQQCSRFHELAEFDEAKRSCRRRLAGHNERRRKNSSESAQLEGSASRKGTSPQMKEIVCGQVDDRGRIQITMQENSTLKHFQIR